MSQFVRRHLDPASRLSEVLFGLIMVLSVTLTAGLTAAEGSSGIRQLLLAAIGCNLAWGIIDAVMYVMNNITVRSLEMRLVHTIQDAPDKDAALNLIRNEIDPRLHSLLDPEESLALSRSIHKRIAQMKVAKVRVTREDLYGAIACFWLVFVSCLSAAVPFLIFSEPMVALRVPTLF